MLKNECKIMEDLKKKAMKAVREGRHLMWLLDTIEKA